MKNPKIGPIGGYPRGKLDDTDEGGLTVMVSGYKNCVRLDFGKKIEWLAIPIDQAVEFATLIRMHAHQIMQDLEDKKNDPS